MIFHASENYQAYHQGWGGPNTIGNVLEMENGQS